MTQSAPLLALAIVVIAGSIFWVTRSHQEAAVPISTQATDSVSARGTSPKSGGALSLAAPHQPGPAEAASPVPKTPETSPPEAPTTLDFAQIEASLRDLASANMLHNGINVNDQAGDLLGQLLSAAPPGPALFAKLLQDPAFDFSHKPKLFWNTAQAHPDTASASGELIRNAAKAALAQNLADGLTDNLFLLPLATLNGGPAEERWLLDKTQGMTMRDSMDLGMAIDALDTISSPAAWTSMAASADRIVAHNAIRALAERHDPAVDQALHQAAVDPSIDTKRRGMIWSQISAAASEDQLPALAAELTASSNDTDRLAASLALTSLRDKKLSSPASIHAVQGLFARALADPLDEVALNAASALAGAKLPVTPELLGRVQDLVARGLPEAAALLEKLRRQSVR